jgi:hypothetical protein
MKVEKYQLRCNNSVCAEAFPLLRGRAPAQLRGNIEHDKQLGDLRTSDTALRIVKCS